ncbi:MAG: cation-translocating P-type ATPase, partial [Clostridia bacterium]
MKKEEIVIERLNPQLTEGLTQKDVDARILAKKNNYVKKTVGKSYPRIFIDNIFTFFNFLGILVFVIMLILQEYKNMMFCIVVLANTVIGIGQEIRAKLSVQKLSLMSSSKATVIRQGIQKEINIADIVLDDVISYNTGKQIPADSIVAIGEIETNEALLTGESEPIKKKVGDTLLSGSFVVSGNCVARVAHVGKDNYAEQLTAKAKKYVKPNSGLVTSITKIIKVISIVVFPIGILTLLTG